MARLMSETTKMSSHMAWYFLAALTRAKLTSWYPKVLLDGIKYLDKDACTW